MQKLSKYLFTVLILTLPAFSADIAIIDYHDTKIRVPVPADFQRAGDNSLNTILHLERQSSFTPSFTEAKSKPGSDIIIFPPNTHNNRKDITLSDFKRINSAQRSENSRKAYVKLKMEQIHGRGKDDILNANIDIKFSENTPECCNITYIISDITYDTQKLLQDEISEIPEHMKETNMILVDAMIYILIRGRALCAQICQEVRDDAEFEDFKQFTEDYAKEIIELNKDPVGKDEAATPAPEEKTYLLQSSNYPRKFDIAFSIRLPHQWKTYKDMPSSKEGLLFINLETPDATTLYIKTHSYEDWRAQDNTDPLRFEYDFLHFMYDTTKSDGEISFHKEIITIGRNSVFITTTSKMYDVDGKQKYGRVKAYTVVRGSKHIKLVLFRLDTPENRESVDLAFKASTAEIEKAIESIRFE